MIHVKRVKIQKIPLYQVQSSALSKPGPVVIALHGFGENKESLLPYAEKMAEQGITLLIPDAPRHGERSGGEGRFTLASIHKITPILLGMLRDVTTLLQFVRTSGEFDGARVGLTGVSMGGVVTLAAMTKHPEVKTGVAMLAMDSARQFARHHKFPKVMWPVVGYLDRFIDRRRIPPRPLLMLNGAEDPVMPVCYVREFVQEIKSRYGSNSQIELVEFPGVGHEVVPEMVDRTNEWFAAHL